MNQASLLCRFLFSVVVVMPSLALADAAYIESPMYRLTFSDGVLDGTPASNVLTRSNAVAPLVLKTLYYPRVKIAHESSSYPGPIIWPDKYSAYFGFARRSVHNVNGIISSDFDHMRYRFEIDPNRPATDPGFTGPVTFRWWEVFTPDDGGPVVIKDRSWIGNGPNTVEFYIDPRESTKNGSWYVVRPFTLLRSNASRAIPGSQLELFYQSAGQLYAGNKTGDVVRFSLFNNMSSAFMGNYPVSYDWRADGPLGRIQGPTGPTASEWVLDGLGNEPYRIFNWRPGVWTIRCTVTFANGATYIAENQEDVGWRTERYLVTGQVRPIEDVKLSAAEIAVVKQEIIDSWNTNRAIMGILPQTLLPSLYLWQVLQGLSAETNAFLWFMVASFPGFVSQPAASEAHRMWMLQTILNKEPDLVLLPPIIDDDVYEELKYKASYRMLTEVQAQYLLDTQGLIRQVEFLPNFQRYLLGPTKIFTDQGFITWAAGNLPMFKPGTNQAHAVAEAGQHHGAQRLASDGMSFSVMTAGRIAHEGNAANFKLFNRQAPFIFTEFHVTIGPEGRDTLCKINLSVNKHWLELGQGQSTISGLDHFNEIRIYERDPAQIKRVYTQRQQLLIANQVRNFVFSVSPSQAAAQIQPQPTLR